jgi:hypothetical protein
MQLQRLIWKAEAARAGDRSVRPEHVVEGDRIGRTTAVCSASATARCVCVKAWTVATTKEIDMRIRQRQRSDPMFRNS